VKGFLESELNSGEVNPFRVWSYIGYLEAGKQAGVTLDDEWISLLVRLNAWTETAPALINGEELRASLDALMF